MDGMSLYIVQTNAVEGRDDEFNEWYDSTHVPDVLSIDGFESAQRFKRSTALDQPDVPTPPYEYSVLYEVSGDPVAAIDRLRAAVVGGRIELTDAMVPGSGSLLLTSLGSKVLASNRGD
ncbi:hypothetical protein CH281_18850 [Rhodococcus sp. 06-221-2]|uniref:DUF4286 family protein n=1 Tax=Nocardiaceae TaxID=85025 RepID=UPI000B9A1A93|nr:DUF4286 family protein [Rhodococcus sp. 06-221-2]NIL85860.1 hypothetical protein [Rhodococcus fascians]NIL91531.1 hypothetical protein [Rhodococcus fascians]OZD00433.1 hypothetical protein CH281_18850 [Rhodococcus sp. 06-221-2]